MPEIPTAMDPALQELVAEGAPGDEVAVIVRLKDGLVDPPSGLRLVARFGTVATGRARRSDLVAIHDHPAVASLKAPRVYAGELGGRRAARDDEPGISEADPAPRHTDRRRPEGLTETGRGTVVAVVDWGCDFAHPDFRNRDGSTRLLALWDQRARGAPKPYGFGRLHDRHAINRALAAPDPLRALGYRPAPGGTPAHGTHVLGIAAGNGRAGGPQGIAPEADLFFCHLGPGIAELGNSIDLMEAIDCAVRVAGNRPLALNLSIGRHAGPHDGSLLIERAIDWLITSRPGIAVVQSTGNYFSRDIHMSGRLRETRTAVLPFRMGRRDETPVTVELWYKGADAFSASVIAPDGTEAEARRGYNAILKGPQGQDYGTLFHRAFDPNNGDHLIALVLRRAAPSGTWRLHVTGLDVVDGRWHAWIERNAACPSCQARFLPDRAEPSTTIGSICNALRTIAVGAYDAHEPDTPLTGFSSVGPTRDGRPKPLLVAPGKDVLSVRSRPDAGEDPGYVRMSGTSMAAPHVTGTLALMLQAAGPHPIAALRQVLFSSLAPPPVSGPRWGYGLLDVEAAVEGARALRAGRAPPAMLLDEAVAAEQAEAVDVPPPEEAAAGGIAVHTENWREEAMTDETDEQETEPPRERLWTKGRDQTLPTAQERVLGPMSDAELETVLGDRPPLVAVASREGGGAEGAGYPAPGEALVRAVDPDDPGIAVIGWPGHRPEIAPRAGDLIVEQGPGQRPCLYVIADPAAVDGRAPGRFAEATDAAGRVSVRRILGADGLIPASVTLLREGTAPETTRPILRNGSRGPAVSEAQTRLNRVHAARRAAGQSGLDACPLEVDGIFGRLTRAATLSFQRIAFPDDRRQWDGVIGPCTWAALVVASDRAAPAAGASVEFVLDDDRDHAVDDRAPVATALMFGLWDRAIDAAGNVRNGVAEASNFVGADLRRFYLRVRDASASTPTVTVGWQTLKRDRSADDAPAVRDVTLTRTAPGSGVYVSRGLMLVSDDADARQPTHSGLATGATAGVRRRGQADHRLRRAALDGFVQASYAPAGGGSRVTTTLPVFERRPEMRRRLNVRVVVYDRHATRSRVSAHFARANLRWAQAGVLLVPARPDARRLPGGAADRHGRYTGSADNPAEQAVMGDLLPVTPDNTVTVVFVRLTGANAYATVVERRRSAIGQRYFIFINPGVDLNNETLGHEFHHVIFNRIDLPNDPTDIDRRRFFSFNTTPPVAYGVTLPDVRVYRRIHTLHAADPNNDLTNDSVINWPRRQRTARFPLPAALAAPDATTGNTLARTL